MADNKTTVTALVHCPTCNGIMSPQCLEKGHLYLCDEHPTAPPRRPGWDCVSCIEGVHSEVLEKRKQAETDQLEVEQAKQKPSKWKLRRGSKASGKS
ncbi:hypothetical protein BDV18DRAFT_164659 [Aspergillus unguis]